METEIHPLEIEAEDSLMILTHRLSARQNSNPLI